MMSVWKVLEIFQITQHILYLNLITFFPLPMPYLLPDIIEYQADLTKPGLSLASHQGESSHVLKYTLFSDFFASESIFIKHRKS